MTTPSAPSRDPSASHRALRLAHRGDWRSAPENTLPALLAALAVPGCDGLEFDVQLCGDGQPILLHDDTLARVQGTPDRAGDLTAAELARYGVPTLTDVLAAVPRETFLDVELKGDPGIGIHAVVAVLEAGRGAALERTAISSFEPAALRAIARARPDWPRWLNAVDLSADTIVLAAELGCVAISVDWRAITPATAPAVREAGLELAAWTVRRRATAARLDRLGVIAQCVEAAALEGPA
jgi:glycerophosphoryl diester phosphodiesterase